MVQINDMIHDLESEGYEVLDYGQTLHVYVYDTVSPGPGGIYYMMPNENMADDIYDIASMYASVHVEIDRQSRVVLVEVLS
jgi:hypothetical protein